MRCRLTFLFPLYSRLRIDPSTRTKNHTCTHNHSICLSYHRPSFTLHLHLFFTSLHHYCLSILCGNSQASLCESMPPSSLVSFANVTLPIQPTIYTDLPCSSSYSKQRRHSSRPTLRDKNDYSSVADSCCFVGYPISSCLLFAGNHNFCTVLLFH